MFIPQKKILNENNKHIKLFFILTRKSLNLESTILDIYNLYQYYPLKLFFFDNLCEKINYKKCYKN